MTEKSEGLETWEDTVEAVEGDMDAVDAGEMGAGSTSVEAASWSAGGLLIPLAQLGSKRADSSSVSGELPEDWVVMLEKVRPRALPWM